MVFSGGFFDAHPNRQFIDTLMFWYIKGVQVMHIWVKIHLLYLGQDSFISYLGQDSFMFDLQFSSFETSNVLIPAESKILGYFWVVFWT